MHYEIEKTGFISALPYVGLTTVMVLSGHLADYLQLKNYLTTTQAIKQTLKLLKYVKCTVFNFFFAFLRSEKFLPAWRF